jgi:hypothetical protein
MTQDNWKIIAASQGVPSLDDSARAVLDRVQLKIGLNDKDFWQFLMAIIKIIPGGVFLDQVLPKLK